MDASLDALLRTLAAVPVESRVLDLGCGKGHRMRTLLQLGFDVYACAARTEDVEATREEVADLVDSEEAERRIMTTPFEALDYPEASFDWVVAFEAYQHASTEESLQSMLAETRRVLRPGGWVYVVVPGRHAADATAEGRTFTPDRLDALMEEADLVQARAPSTEEAESVPVVQAIYRRVEEHS